MFACREGSGLRGVDNHLAPLIPFAWSGVGWNSYSSRKTERASECESQMGEWPMALDGLRLGLMALGYQQVIWTHLHCITHGVFRLVIAYELEEYPCPACQQACKVAIIAQGHLHCITHGVFRLAIAYEFEEYPGL